MSNLIFRLATIDDWELLLNWRNDPETRRNSFFTKRIMAADHKKWLGDSIQNPNRKVYIVLDSDIPIGTVRVDIKAGNKEISWTTGSGSRGKGYGKEMVHQLVESLSGNILAKIKRSNLASIKIAEYSGFKFYNQDHEVSSYIKEDNNEN